MLHFNEQFRQLDEISDDSEKLPPSVKLTLLQTAVRSIKDLRIVETLDEFQSTTHGHGSSTFLSYQTYYDLTEFRQPLQVQSHLEMPRILVQLGHTQRT